MAARLDNIFLKNSLSKGSFGKFANGSLIAMTIEAGVYYLIQQRSNGSMNLWKY